MSSVAELLHPGYVYHIWSHAVGHDNLFVEEENYRFFLSRYFKYTGSILSTFAYCLMPNHIHFMIRVLDEEKIASHPKYKEPKNLDDNHLSRFVSRQIGHFFNSYTKSYNNRYSRSGSLFERPFGRNLIDSENYYTQLVVYIHLNPLKHGFVKNINKWPYSSWHSYVNRSHDMVLKEEVLGWFGGIDGFIYAHMQDDGS